VVVDFNPDKPEWNRWPFSSYGPDQNITLFAGTDISFEEDRFAAYQARAAGTFQDYVNQRRAMEQECRHKFYELHRNPMAFLQEAQSSTGSGGGLGRGGESVFGGGGGGVFGGSIFGGQQQQQQQQQQPARQSVFGGTTTSNPFSLLGGGQTSQQTPQQPQTAFGSVFGGQLQQQPAPSSTFGTTSLLSGPTTQSSVFGGGAGGAGTSVFGQQPQALQSTPLQSPFGLSGGQLKLPTMSPFSQPAVVGASNPFGLGAGGSGIGGLTTSSFGLEGGGRFPTQTPALQGFSSVASSSSSSSSACTPEEMSAFQATAFVFGKIPEVEPPPSVC
jgi:hypothetical protein